MELVEQFDSLAIPFTQKGDFRADEASGNGGFELYDDVLLGKHRSVIAEMIAVSASMTV